MKILSCQLSVLVFTYHDEAVPDPELLPVLRALGDVHGLAVDGEGPRRRLAHRTPGKNHGPR